jgi:ribosomal protein L40E
MIKRKKGLKPFRNIKTAMAHKCRVCGKILGVEIINGDVCMKCQAQPRGGDRDAAEI